MTNLFLQAAGASGMGWVTPVFMAAMIAVMYFFMIRPQQQKAKEQKLFVESMKKGDKIVTLAGIHGKINSIDETNQTILVEVADNVRIKMDKSAISTEYTRLAYPNKEA
jgi:preprotein translocase subunit YajC